MKESIWQKAMYVNTNIDIFTLVQIYFIIVQSLDKRIMKFTQYVADGILKDIADGIPYKISCESFGISYSTFKNWLQNAARDQEEGKETIYTQFLSSLRKVQKDVIKGHLSSVRDSDKGHKGKEWELERSYWQYFSAKAAEIDLNERVEELEQKRGKENASETKADACEARKVDQESSPDEAINPS